jgi:hypothetical protein
MNRRAFLGAVGGCAVVASAVVMMPRRFGMSEAVPASKLTTYSFVWRGEKWVLNSIDELAPHNASDTGFYEALTLCPPPRPGHTDKCASATVQPVPESTNQALARSE